MIAVVRSLPTTVTSVQTQAALRALGLDPKFVVAVTMDPEGITVTVHVRDETGRVLAHDDGTPAKAFLFVPVVPAFWDDAAGAPPSRES